MATKDEMAKFAKDIDSLVSKTDYTYLEAIIAYCDSTGLELELAASLINSNLKSKLENDAINNRMLKEKVSRLPL